MYTIVENRAPSCLQSEIKTRGWEGEGMDMVRVQRAASVLKSSSPKSPGIQTAAVMDVCGTPHMRKASIHLQGEMF